ncbi:hypothetical protein GCM10010264_60470 [Streptomyces globisporus]|nr:hypothetical protein GCM10010264_60470 [Streptomyces globisporus]
MALETNSERSGASSAQSGRETRGARNRFSQSGAAAASVVMSPSNPIARPARNGMRNSLAGTRVRGWDGIPGPQFRRANSGALSCPIHAVMVVVDLQRGDVSRTESRWNARVRFFLFC